MDIQSRSCSAVTKLSMKKLALGWLGLFVAITAWCAAEAPASDTLVSGFSTQRLQRIRARLQRRVDARQLAGAVYLVSRDGKPVVFQAVGWSDVEAGRPMEKDSLFRVYSMSKPVVGIAVLMLVEDGKLRLTDPISSFIPEFQAQRVAVPGPAGSAEFSTVAASRDITIRDLLTHTSGLGSGPISDSEIKRLHRSPQDTLASFIPRLGGTPLEFQPGTRWHYSGMAGFDTLGRVVEIVSGEPLDRYLSRHLFLPLGIKDMSFAPSAEQLRRLASVYLAKPEGLVKLPHQDDPINPTYLAGSSGLVSTVLDYFKFAQMLCGGGQAGGVRLLSPRMVELLSSEAKAGASVCASSARGRETAPCSPPGAMAGAARAERIFGWTRARALSRC